MYSLAAAAEVGISVLLSSTCTAHQLRLRYISQDKRFDQAMLVGSGFQVLPDSWPQVLLAQISRAIWITVGRRHLVGGAAAGVRKSDTQLRISPYLSHGHEANCVSAILQKQGCDLYIQGINAEYFLRRVRQCQTDGEVRVQ